MASANRVKETTTSTSTATITLAGKVTNYRAFSSGFAASSTGIRVMVGPDSAGAWLIGMYTLTNATTLTRTSIIDSSLDGADVALAAGSKEVFYTLDAAYLGGITIGDLSTAGTIADTYVMELYDPATGNSLKATVSALKAIFGSGGASAPVATVSGVTVSPSSASIAGAATQQFTATVAGTNSPSQSVTWSANLGTINSAGLYTAPAATGATQSATITAASVADNTKSGTATVSIAAAGVQTITVNTPSTQTVGTAYNVTGTYANGTPTALDYSIDSGSTWTAATSPTISGGTYSFSVTPSTASASRTMMVRDHATLVSGTSGAYVVNAAASTYTVTGYGTTPNAPKTTLDMSAAQTSGGKKYVLPGVPFTDGSGYFIVKNGGTQVANGTTGIYAGWSQSNAANGYPATTLTGGTPNTGANNVAAFTQMSVNATAAQVTAYFWATPGTENGNWYLWFKFPDGSTYCFNPAAPLVVSGA